MAYGTPAAAENVTLCTEAIFTDYQVQYRLYLNLPLSVFGIVTNIVNVLVFLDSDMIHSLVNHFLLALSISDLFLLVCNFFFLLFPVMALMTDSFVLHDLYPSLVRYSYPLALTSQTCSVYLTVLVSFHRFLGVCHPFRAKRWVTARPVKFAIIGSVVFSVIVNLSTWIELSVERCYYKLFERESRHITLTAVQQYFLYGLIKRVIGYTLIMFVVPFLILIFVNHRIIIALKQSTNLRKFHVDSGSSKKKRAADTEELNQFRLLRQTKYSELFSMFSKLNSGGNFAPPSSALKHSQSSVRDRSVTMMLLAIVAMFLGCNGLAFCNNIIEILIFVDSAQNTQENTLSTNSENMVLFEKSVEIANILVSLNSATSLFVYLIFSTKYRSVVKQYMGLEKRIRVNAVALTTAMAAQKALELSIIPDESMNRSRPRETRAAKKIAFRSGRSKTMNQADALLRRAPKGIETAEESSSLLRTNTIDIADTNT